MVTKAKIDREVEIYVSLNKNKKSLRGQDLYDLITCLIIKKTRDKRMREEIKNV
ncbi:MAG: hypothetical protein ACTTKH_00495 [Treponema sp.]